jgi:hypothetical protein
LTGFIDIEKVITATCQKEDGMPNVYKPGEVVVHSGIYKVVHDPKHINDHDVTCVEGKKFPTCRGCPNPRFILERAARHIDAHEQFNK